MIRQAIAREIFPSCGKQCAVLLPIIVGRLLARKLTPGEYERLGDFLLYSRHECTRIDLGIQSHMLSR